MFGRRRETLPPPTRSVWADVTKKKLEDVRKRRQELVSALDAEERNAKELCNHTYPNGTSAIEVRYDYEDDREYTSCSVCQQ